MPGEMVPRTPGFTIFYAEWVDRNGHYSELYLHVPDTFDRDWDRRQWVQSTGAIPAGGAVTYMGRRECQDHLFNCRASDHSPPTRDSVQVANESLSILRENLRRRDRERDYGSDLRGNSPPQWGPGTVPPGRRLAPNEMSLIDQTWEDFVADNPPPTRTEWEDALIPSDAVGACGLAGCGCTDDDFDPAIPDIPPYDPETGRILP
jgi:hypothetical protein